MQNKPADPAAFALLNLRSLRVRLAVVSGLFVLLAVGLILIVSSKTTSADASSHILFLTLISLPLFSSAIVYFLLGRVTRPIMELKKCVEAFGQGSQETTPALDCDCEIGELADAYRTMVTKLNEHSNRLQELAFIDPLTGAQNRLKLSKDITNKIKGGLILAIEIENYKNLIDRLGFHLADEFLLEIVNKLRCFFEEQGFKRTLSANFDDCKHFQLYRFSDQKFIIILFDDAPNTAHSRELIRDLFDILENSISIRNQRISLKTSLGAVEVEGSQLLNLNHIQNVKYSLIKAKKLEKRFYFSRNAEIEAEIKQRDTLEASLSNAFERHEFEVHYQPKYSLADDSLCGLEALVRWNHPELGLLFPGSFLPIVESSGNLGRIAEEVLRITSKDISNNANTALISQKISINICPSQFLDENFSKKFLDQLNGLGVAPANYELELTETVALRDTDIAERHMSELKNAGFSISIDDFGMGFSNLSQLSRLPFDCLKIDKSLVDGLVDKKNNRTIIGSIIRMAHGLEHYVVAEGVENPEQLKILRELGCDAVQGYYVGRPASLSDLLSPNDTRQSAHLAFGAYGLA
ncbi:putative bifunctional diguanylate cyclase/phosphodiesterase [Roseibium sp. ROS1]